MNFIFTKNGISIGRDSTDKKIYRESAVIGQALKNLNSQSELRWFRFYPYKHGLTASRIGLKCKSGKETFYYWHGNYEVESASEAWNAGRLFLNKA